MGVRMPTVPFTIAKQGAQHIRGRIVQTPAQEQAGWSAVTVDLADGANVWRL